MKLSAFALCMSLLAACSTESSDRAPDVDWSHVTQAQKGAIEWAAANRDCGTMDAYYDTVSSPDVIYYLDWAMKKAGC